MDDEPSSVVECKKQTRALPRPDVSNEKEVIESIEASYFIEDDFDAVDYELKKLMGVEQLCTEDVDRERLRLKEKLKVVSKKISTLILEKAPSYSSQMADVHSIRDELALVIERVRCVRKYLSECRSKSNYTIGVLANDRHKRLLLSLKTVLLKMKTLHETEYRIHELLEDGKFPLAIRVCVEAMEAAKSFSHLNCVEELRVKMRGSSDTLEQALDSALSSLICVFDPDKYLLVCNAYHLLGKVEDMGSGLVTLSCAALERRARQVIASEAVQADHALNAEILSYEKLCEVIPCDRIAEALRELGFALCQVLMNVHTILALHAEEEERERMLGTEGSSPSSIISRALSSSLYTIFRTALTRFNTLLACHDFAELKFDDVLTVIELATKFRQFGRRYFGHSALEINISLEKQSDLFFTRQHSEKMDELRMFVENEAFAVCPLPSNFCLFDLQEFEFLRKSRGRASTSKDDETDSETIGEQLDYIAIPSNANNPFATNVQAPGSIVEKKRNPSQNGNSSLDHRRDSEERREGGPPSPNLCNSALVVLRLLGRYIRMTSLLHSIADRSVVAITQLFEYFLFAVVEFFGKDGAEYAKGTSVRLKEVLHRIERDLFSSDNYDLHPPVPSCVLQLQFADRLFALPERIVAIESIEFVARQLDLTRPVIESLLVEGSELATSDKLHSFYSQVLACVPDVRQSIMAVVAAKALKLPLLISTIASTQWNVTELQSKHSTYVDFLLQDLEVFSLRLQHLCLEVKPTDDALRSLLWDRVIETAIHALVQGYGQVGARCSNEGRALMQLDVQHLSGRIERLTGRTMPERIAYVDAYVKAYYLPEKHLEEWALSHPEYTADQVINLLAATTHVSKKTRTRIISALSASG